MEKMVNLCEVILVGCCTDICITNLGIPLNNYFNQYDRNVNIIVPTNAVETYDSPLHSREKYNEMAFELMIQAGLKLVKKYERGNKNGK